jgi:glycosyltransferase involved in cell wall biosynthesis
MKVLYFITKANPWGGAQRYVYDLAKAARDGGFDVSVAYGVPGEMSQRLAGADIRLIEIAELGRDVALRDDVASFSRMRTLLIEERPDILHINSSKAGLIGGLAGRLTRVPRIIFTAHGWAFNETRPWWQKLIFRALHYATVALSHTTICVSEAVRRDIATMPFIAGKLVVIRNGVAPIDFKERLEARAHLAPELRTRFWFGMLGELHPTKGVFEAVEAFAALAKEFSDAALVIMGEGHARAPLEKEIARVGLTDRVVLAGQIAEGSSYLRAFDIFLFPSRSEALGYALIEAGYAGLPVIATRVGGIPEIIPDSSYGLLVPKSDTPALAGAMRRLAQDANLRRSLAGALHDNVSGRFTAKRMTRDTLALYRS